MIRIRSAELRDAECILGIYGWYVLNTAITFEYDVPDPESFRQRIEKTLKRYPYLVIEQDGIIQGYAYAGPFVDRAAYDRSCETTVYLDHNARRSGLGRRIYEALESKLREMGMLNLYARIGYPETEDEYLTKNSVQFHEHLGWHIAGKFQFCGYKFGRWYHMICMEKIIGAHADLSHRLF